MSPWVCGRVCTWKLMYLPSGGYVTETFSCHWRKVHLPPFLYFSTGPPLGGAQTMGKNTEQRPQPGMWLKHAASRLCVNHTTTQLWSQSMVEWDGGQLAVHICGFCAWAFSQPQTNNTQERIYICTECGQDRFDFFSLFLQQYSTVICIACVSCW